MTDEDAAEFLGSYGLTDSGLSRLIRKSYHLLGLISFFTAGEDELPRLDDPSEHAEPRRRRRDSLDLEKHFIRAETIRWDQLLEAGSEANARAKGTLRLEGKDLHCAGWDDAHQAQWVLVLSSRFSVLRTNPSGSH